MRDAVMYSPTMDVTCRLLPRASMSEYYRVSTGRRDMPEKRETRRPGSVLAFDVVPTTTNSLIPKALPAIRSDTLSVGTGNPLPNFLPT